MNVLDTMSVTQQKLMVFRDAINFNYSSVKENVHKETTNLTEMFLHFWRIPEHLDSALRQFDQYNMKYVTDSHAEIDATANFHVDEESSTMNDFHNFTT